MMGFTYEEALNAFNRGDFAGFQARLAPHTRTNLDPQTQALLAFVLAMDGKLKDAEEAAHAAQQAGNAGSAKAYVELATAMVRWRQGNLQAAFHHSNAAVHAAVESHKPDLIAWATLHRFRLLVQSGPLEKTLAALPDIRRVVARSVSVFSRKGP